jgi:hypothetical protein
VQWRGKRRAELEDQSWAVLRIAKGDRSTVVDENCRHPDPVDVEPDVAAIDGNPLAAVVVKYHQGGVRRRTDAVEGDVHPAAEPDGHVATWRKGVSTRAEPDDQRGTERSRRHRHPLFRPTS